MTRDELQKSAAGRLERTGRLICQWATGTGKSGVVLKFLQEHPDMQCLILVPEQNNIQNWLDEFEKFRVPCDNVWIACYASFHKYENTVWDLLVFDEMPHVDTEKRLAICNSVKGSYVLALGAVIDEEERQSLESVYGFFDKSVVNLEKAISLGFLPPPTVVVMHLVLDDTEYKYRRNGRMFTAKQRYMQIQKRVDDTVNLYRTSPSEYSKRQMFSAGLDRKRFLGKLKEDAVTRLCEALERKKARFLCFCPSIDQAERIGGDHAFTSKTPVSMKLLEKFNSHEIDSLYVVGKLIEGQNLNDIQAGVISQLGGTQRITVQSIGRIMRSPNPLIYVPVFDGTKDEDFLRILTASIPETYIKHYNYK